MTAADYAMTALLAPRHGGRDWSVPPIDYGRLLTVPEINRIRFQYGLSDENFGNPWNRSFMTSTTEYYGTSAGGIGLAVVSHGNGPSSPEFERDPAAFKRLLDGVFGPVHIVELAETWRHARQPSGSKGTRALRNPLTVARLGGPDDAAALLKFLSFRSGEIGFEGCHTITRLPRPGETGASRVALSKVETARSALAREDRKGLAISTATESSQALGYFGTLSAPVTTSPGAVKDIAPALRLSDVLADVTKATWVADGREDHGLVRLRTCGDVLMTCETPPAPGLTPGWPRHNVVSFTRRGKPMHLPEAGFASRLAAKAGLSNAYLFLSSSPSGCVVQFGHAVVDWSIRMPSSDELLHDWPIWETAARIAAEKWWNEKTAAKSADPHGQRPVPEFPGERSA